MIDQPLVDLVYHFNLIPQCFTLQTCYGHFLYKSQNNPNNIEGLPITDTITKVEYRIAYIAFCVENSDQGKSLLHDLMSIFSIDPDNIQFGSAEWFWQRQVNTYVLQVVPEKHKRKDRMTLEYSEALLIQKAKTLFFKQLELLLSSVKH